DGVLADERLDVLGVRVAGVLGARRGPQQPLHLRAGLAELRVALPSLVARLALAEALLEDLVRQLGARHRRLAPQRASQFAVGAALLCHGVEQRVDHYVDAAEEEAGHA